MWPGRVVTFVLSVGLFEAQHFPFSLHTFAAANGLNPVLLGTRHSGHNHPTYTVGGGEREGRGGSVAHAAPREGYAGTAG